MAQPHLRTAAETSELSSRLVRDLVGSRALLVHAKAAHSTISSAGSIESLRLEWDDAIESLDSDYLDDLLDDSAERRGPAVFVTRKDGSRSEVMPIIEAVIDHYSSALWMRNGDP